MSRQHADSGLERNLRRLLRRTPPPVGFRARLMRRIAATAEVRSRKGIRMPPFRLPMPTRRVWAFAGLAFACTLLAVLAGLGTGPTGNPTETAEARAERELAEVLQLAGSQWLRAQQAAFDPPQEYAND
ncbi:MAG: hypothetical protein OXN89_18975 [Bryobacterales bacterium]|nr:hypothetical protein [Bryobacterales bacterium]